MLGPGRSTRRCRSINAAAPCQAKSNRDRSRLGARLPSLWVAVVLGFLGCGPAAYAEDLTEVLRLGRQHDPTYLEAKAAYKAEKETLPQARALLLPNISASANRTRFDNETTTKDSGGPDETSDVTFSGTGYSLSLTQPLYNAALFAGLKQAKVTVRKAQAEFAAAEQALFIRVAQAYFGLLLAHVGVDLAVAEKTANKTQLDLANARLEVGLGTITDVHDAKARYELGEAQEIEATNALDDAREALRELTARTIEQVARPRPGYPLVSPDPPDIDIWMQKALAQNLSVIAAEAGAEIARQEIRRQRAGHFPTVDIVGSSSSDDDVRSVVAPDTEIERDSNSIGVELNLPLIQGGLVSSLTAEAKHRYDAATQAYERERRNTVRTTRSAYLGVSSGVKRIRALNQAVIASESALEAKQEGFQAGIETNIDVLNAQRDLFRAKRDYVDAHYDYIINILLLKQAAGILAESDLLEINKWLE